MWCGDVAGLALFVKPSEKYFADSHHEIKFQERKKGTICCKRREIRGTFWCGGNCKIEWKYKSEKLHGTFTYGTKQRTLSRP